MDLVRTREWRTADGSIIDDDLVKYLSKRVFSKADYQRQTAKLEACFPDYNLFRGIPYSVLQALGQKTAFDQDLKTREAIDATSLLWLCKHILSFKGDAAGDLAEDFENHVTNGDLYRGVQQTSITRYKAFDWENCPFGFQGRENCVIELKVEVGSFYGKLLERKIEQLDSLSSGHAISEDGRTFVTLAEVCWLTPTDEPREEGDRADLIIRSFFPLEAEEETEPICVDTAIKLCASFIVNLHLVELQTLCDLEGRLYRNAADPLTRIWQLAFEIPAGCYTGTCSVCGNSWVSKSKARTKCDKCSNYRGYLNGKKRTIY